MGMTRDIFKDKALSLLLGERFIGLPLFDSENIEEYRLSDKQGDMCFEDFLDHFYTLLAVEKWIKAEELENGSENDLPSVNPQESKTEQYQKEIDHLHKYITKLETQIVEQEPKEIYDKGYADGMRALAYHMELCKNEAGE